MNREVLPQYLTAIRDACRTASKCIPDASELRRMEQVCVVLNRMIANATTVPALQARVEQAYRAQLKDLGAADFATQRAAVQDWVRTVALTDANVDRTAAIVDIESEYFRSYDAAVRQVNAAERAALSTGSTSAETALPDSAALGQYLTEVLKKPIEVVKFDTVALGFSKATYLLSTRSDQRPAEDLIIRMDRPFNYLGTTVVDEFPVLQVLHRHGICVPRPYALESSGAVLGQPFIVVARVDGRNLGSHFTFAQADPRMCEKFAQHLARIHAVPLTEFSPNLRGRNLSAAAQLRAAIDKYYADWSQLDAVSPIIEAAFQWLKQHVDDVEAERCFVHGDFSLSNVLIDEHGEFAAILDWEFAAAGHPASDLGWFHFMAKALGSWDHFLRAYAAAGGVLPDRKQLDFYVLWGALRLAIMNYQLDSAFESARSSDIKHAFAAAAFMPNITVRVADVLRALL